MSGAAVQESKLDVDMRWEAAQAAQAQAQAQMQEQLQEMQRQHEQTQAAAKVRRSSPAALSACCSV